MCTRALPTTLEESGHTPTLELCILLLSYRDVYQCSLHFWKNPHILVCYSLPFLSSFVYLQKNLFYIIAHIPLKLFSVRDSGGSERPWLDLRMTILFRKENLSIQPESITPQEMG